MKTKFFIPLAGLVLFCACKGKPNYEVINNSSAGNADTVSKADSIALPKLVKTAGILFKVKNVAHAAEHITAITTAFNGIVTHNQMGSTATRSEDIRISNDSVMQVTAFNTTAEMTVKIPSAKLEDFMGQVAKLGIYVNERNMDITDKSLDYLSAQLKLKNRAELVSQQKTGRVVIKKPEDVLNLKDDMIDQQINNREIDDAVKNSMVTLSFYQSNTINKEVIANDDPSAYNLPFFKRLGIAIENGWQIFVCLIIWIANLWVFVLAGIGALLLIRYYKSRKIICPVKIQ